MPGTINSRFGILLAEKENREKRKISLKEVQRETGITWSTLNSWTLNKISRFDASVLISLCDYLNCCVGEIVVYNREDIKGE